MTYGAETLTLTKTTISKLQVTQRAMERIMLGVSLRDRIPNATIHRRSGVTDVIVRITTRILEWRPRIQAHRNRERPPTRWADDIKRIVTYWIQVAQDRTVWTDMREAYVQQWTSGAI